MIEPITIQSMKSSTLNSRIASQRMLNQHIAGIRLETAHDVVSRMGFLQAQDYLGSLWAVGLRMKSATEAQIEQALLERSIVRTWPSRNTLGYIAAEDVRWILDLLTPRAFAARQGRYRRLGLSEDDFKTGARLIEGALKEKHQLTREESRQVLEKGGISAEGQRGIHILSHLALEKRICFGARMGRQQTFVLMDDWIPPSKPKTREEALGELTLRFFTSHGPATAKDFAWWSGVTLADVKTGLQIAGSKLAEETIEGKRYWLPASGYEPGETLHGGVLLPGFDEYLVGYTDRSAVLDPALARRVNANGGMLNPVIVIDGVVRGTWKRTLKKDTVRVEVNWFEAPGSKEVELLESAVQPYGKFLGLKAEIL